MEEVKVNNNLFNAIKNLVELANNTDDKHKATRHMARALLLITKSNLSDRENQNLCEYLKEDVIRMFI